MQPSKNETLTVNDFETPMTELDFEGDAQDEIIHTNEYGQFSSQITNS